MSTRDLSRVIVLGVFVFGFVLVDAFGDGKNSVPVPMTGSWKGEAQIIVVWCKQTNLQVRLHIQRDGQVTGKVGDAVLRNGRFERNRGWLGRKLNLKTDYLVSGDLDGPIVAAENILRRSVSVPLNFYNGKFAGGVHTSGTHIGAKNSMVLSAAGLKLSRGESRD
jgi:hypothetical protein